MKIKAKIKIASMSLLWFMLMVLLKVQAAEPANKATNVQVYANGNDWFVDWDYSGSADRFLIVMHNNSNYDFYPGADGQSYNVHDVFGSGIVVGNVPGNQTIVQLNSGSFVGKLLHHFYVIPFNSGGSAASNDYKTDDLEDAQIVTPGLMDQPTQVPANFEFTVGDVVAGVREVNFSFNCGCFEYEYDPVQTGFVISYKIGSEGTWAPVDGVTEITSKGSYAQFGDSQAKLAWSSFFEVVNESIYVEVTEETQEVYFKVFSFRGTSPDYALSTEYMIDSRNYQSVSLDAVVAVEPEMNEYPIITDATYYVTEESNNGDIVGTVQIEDPEGDYYDVFINSGDPDDVFDIDNEGNITLNDASLLDFDNWTDFTLELVAATEFGNGWGFATISYNSPPEFDLETTSFDLDENEWWAEFFEVFDDGPSCDVEVTIESDNADLFQIYKYTNEDGCNFEIATLETLDYEQQSSHIITLKAEDALGGISTVDLTINVNNLNDNLPIAENATFAVLPTMQNGDEIGTLEASDADGDNLGFYILSGNTGEAFVVDEEGVISINDVSALDFDNWTDYSLEIEVSDPTDWVLAMITIRYNQSPQFNWESTVFTIDEGAWSEPIMVPLEDDQSICNLTVMVDDEDDAFRIDAIDLGNETCAYELLPESDLDYEEKQTYIVTLTADDGQGGITTSEIIINLNNLNDNLPEAEDATFMLLTTAVNGDEVGALEATDADGDDLGFYIQSGNTGDAFSIDADGLITINDVSALDFDNWADYVLEVEVSDADDWVFAYVTITLNENPTFEWETTTFEYDEEEWWTPGIFFMLSDDGSTCDLEVTVEDDEEGLFTIYKYTNDDGCNFELAANEILDYEEQQSYLITLKAVDANGGVSYSDITININNINDNAPTAEDETYSLFEGSAIGTSVGMVSAEDLDGDELTYTFKSGNTDDTFLIDATGEIKLNATLDIDITPSYDLVLEISDGLNVTEVTVTVNLTAEENEVPVIESQSFDIAENTAEGTLVGEVLASDADGDALTFSIVSGNTGDAFVLETTGELKVNSVEALDFETNPSFSLEVEVTDEIATSTAIIKVKLTDIANENNSTPVIADQIFTIEEKSANGTSVGQVIATDDDGDNLLFSIIDGNSEDVFTIGSSSGEIFVNKSEALNMTINSQFELTVQVSDGEVEATAVVTIMLNEIEDDQVMAIDDINAVGLSLYPNPCVDHFSISESFVGGEIFIFDAQGRQVSSFIANGKNGYDISLLNPGLYHVKIRKDNIVHNNSLVVK